MDASETPRLVKLPLFPRYSDVRSFMKAIEGETAPAVVRLMQAIDDQLGTRQDPVDWSQPDNWIHDRLSGDHAELALKVWSSSERRLNPRYLRGCYYFCNTYSLVRINGSNFFQVTDRGHGFLNDHAPTIYQLDYSEGLIELLDILAGKGKSQRSDVLPEWSAFLAKYSGLRTDSTRTDALWRRLRNLLERNLVARVGNKYELTGSGLEWLSSVPSSRTDPKRTTLRAIDDFNAHEKEEVRRRLSSVDPYRFEYLISQLLVQMGYDDVEVTKQSGDKGIDVTATAQFGITRVKEFIQVKRQAAAIGRQTLDQLRGALPYHQALRGTLITLGDFSKGCAEAALFRGAAPITLINGDQLLELMADHELGFTVSKKKLLELDDTFFEGNLVSDSVT